MQARVAPFIVLIIVLIFYLLSDGVVTGVLSAIISVFSIGSVALFLNLAFRRDSIAPSTNQPVLLRLSLSLVLMGLAIGSFFTSYWIADNHFSSVICRSAPCNIGVYGWSATLLSLTVACNLLLISLILLARMKGTDR
jgi:hypothetical protein